MTRKERKYHRCDQCRNAYLMRSEPINPVVSECKVTKRREVANTPIECEIFVQRFGDMIIHEMIDAKMF